MDLPESILIEYPKGTACIRFLIDGTERDWHISALAGVDNEETLRAHLRKHMPDAVFIGWAIK